MTINVYGDVHIHLDGEEGQKERPNIRTSPAMNTAKKKIKERDKICQCCGEGTAHLEVHHIFPLAKHQ